MSTQPNRFHVYVSLDHTGPRQWYASIVKSIAAEVGRRAVERGDDNFDPFYAVIPWHIWQALDETRGDFCLDRDRSMLDRLRLHVDMWGVVLLRGQEPSRSTAPVAVFECVVALPAFGTAEREAFLNAWGFSEDVPALDDNEVVDEKPWPGDFGREFGKANNRAHEMQRVRLRVRLYGCGAKTIEVVGDA